MSNTMRYDWREHYFAAPRGQFKRKLEDSSVRNARGENEGQRSRRLARVLNILVPRFDLIPRIQPNSDAASAFAEAKARESSALVRWICGDPTMTRDTYHEFRLGTGFAELDKRIDSPRQDTALRNLEKLFRVREDTKEVRKSVQQTIAEVVDGIRSAQDVERELIEQLKCIGSHFISKSKMASSCFVTGPEVGYDIAAEILAHVGKELPVIGLPFKLLHAAEAAFETVRNVSESRALLADNPLAFFSVGASKLKNLS